MARKPQNLQDSVTGFHNSRANDVKCDYLRMIATVCSAHKESGESGDRIHEVKHLLDTHGVAQRFEVRL